VGTWSVGVGGRERTAGTQLMVVRWWEWGGEVGHPSTITPTREVGWRELLLPAVFQKQPA
jgi:hypothetical protein